MSNSILTLRSGSLLAAFASSLSTLAAPTFAGDGSPHLRWVGAGQVDMSGLDVTPDGATLVTTSSIDQTVKLWRAEDGSFVRTLAAHVAGVLDVALSPDGARLVSGGQVLFGGTSNVLVWDVAAGTVEHELEASSNDVFCVDWSADGALVAAGDQGNTIRIWSASSGALVRTLVVPGSGGVFDIAFSPDGVRLAAGCADNTVRIFTVATGKLRATLSGHTFFVDSVAYSPDGTRLASGSWDNSIRTWNMSSFSLEHVLTGHTDIVRDLAFSPDGVRLASGSWDHTIRLWNATSGAALDTFASPDPGAVNALRWTPDGTRLAAGGIGEGGIVLAASDGALVARLGHHHAGISAVAVSPDGARLVSGSIDTDCRVWDSQTGEDLLTFSNHQDIVNAVDLSADGSIAVTASGSPPPDTVDTTVRVWDTATGAQLFVFAGHVAGTTGANLSPDEGTVVSGGRDGRVRVGSTTSGALVTSFDAGTGALSTSELSPDGTRIAVAGNAVRIFTVPGGALVASLAVPGGNGVVSLAWSADGTLVLGGESAFGDNLHLWDASSGTLLRTFSGDPDGFVQGVALSPDGQEAACASGFSHAIRTFDAGSGALLKHYDQETGWGPFPLLPLAYAPDGALAYGRSDSTVVLSGCRGSFTVYGSGGAGSAGIVPTLTGSGCPSPGEDIVLEIANGLGGATGLILLGLGNGVGPLVDGLDLQILPTTPIFAPLTLSGSGDGGGEAQVQSTLDPALGAVDLYVQAFFLDAGVPSGISGTNPLHLHVE